MPIRVEITPYTQHGVTVYTATGIIHGWLADYEGFSTVTVTLLAGEEGKYEFCETLFEGTVPNKHTDYLVWLFDCKRNASGSCSLNFQPAWGFSIGSIRGPEDCFAFILDEIAPLNGK